MSAEAKLWKRLDRFGFLRVEAEFPSLYSLPESILRLRTAASQSNGFFAQSMEGEFYGVDVLLFRVIPLVGASRDYIFKGSFHDDGDGVVLRGTFEMKPWRVVYERCVFVFLAFVGVVSFLPAIVHPLSAWWPPVAVGGALCVQIGQLRVWARIGRSNAAWLSRQIGRTLGHPESWPEPPSRPSSYWRKKWQAMSGQ